MSITLTNDGCITITLLGYSIGSYGGGGGCPFRRRSEYTTRVFSLIGVGCGLFFFTLVCFWMIDRSAYTTGSVRGGDKIIMYNIMLVAR